MIGGPYQGAIENGVAMHGLHSNQATDLTSLITTLISELRNTLNTRMDLLQGQINIKEGENVNLREENLKLKEIITKQEAKIDELSRKENSSTLPKAQTSNGQQQKQRGIKNHNLVICCPDSPDSTPKEIVEDIFATKFKRKPSINSIQKLTSNQSTNEIKLLVTLNSIWEVKAIYKERVKALRNSGIYVSEDLNREESYLFYLARCLKKEKKIHNSWTENGDVYITESMGSISKLLNLQDPILSQIKEKTQGKPHTKINQANEMTNEELRNQDLPKLLNQQTPSTSKEDDPQTTLSDSAIDKVKNNTSILEEIKSKKKTTRQKKQDE